MAIFCRYCGNELNTDATFCRKCGQKVLKTSEQQVQDAAGPSMGPDNMPTFGYAPYPLPHPYMQQNTSESKQKILFRIFAIVLACSLLAEACILAFWRPGFLRKDLADQSVHTKTESRKKTLSEGTGIWPSESVKDFSDSIEEEIWYQDGTYQLEHTWETEQIAEGTFTEEQATISSGDVSMTVEDGFLTDDTNAEIRVANETVPYTVEGVTVDLTMYEFNAEGIFDETLMTLEIPIEKPDGGEVGCGWYDEATGTLWPVSFDYDEERGVAQIYATHLSTYCGFPIKDENTRNAMIAYVSNDELDKMFEKVSGEGGLKNAVNCMVHTVEGEPGDWELGMQVANDLGTANMIVGSAVSVADSIGGLEQSMIRADGVGDSYIKNSIGTVGEIMNTNWGKAGSMPKWFRNYHGKAVDVPLTDKLKSVYPYGDISRIGNNIAKMNIALSTFKIINAALKKDTSAAVWETAQLGIDRALNFLAAEKYGIQLPGLGTYMIGVGLLAYALGDFYSKALQGRKDVYIHAYEKYYLDKSKDGGYRKGSEWVEIISNITKNSANPKEASAKIEEEVDNYVNQFWRTYGSAAYLKQVMTDDEKRAWGVAGEAGLSDEDKKTISDSYKRQLQPIIENAVTRVNIRNREAEKEQFKRSYEQMRRQLNRRITIHISDGTTPGEESPYAGCTVRFAGIHENPNVENKKQYETTLNAEGTATITMTLLSHILVNAGDVMEIVSKTQTDENGQPKVLGQHHFSMESPSPSDPYCVFGPEDMEEEQEEKEEEEEANGIEPFLGQYQYDGRDKYNRFILRENYIKLPVNGVNKIEFDSYRLEGDTLIPHFGNAFDGYQYRLIDKDHLEETTSKGEVHTLTRVPKEKEVKEWGEEYFE